jgi:dephospho-CoA kinase
VVDQRRIGLTGGIATGKTTVSRYLETVHHLPILDADIYARRVVEPGTPTLSRIALRYGPGILCSDGTLNRQQLGNIIFRDAAERDWLEQQIHPQVRDLFREKIQAHPCPQFPTLVLAIPLLFEARMTDLVTEIWVVTCPLEQQIARLMHRDRSDQSVHLSQEQAQMRINSQLPLEQKIALADQVLDNSSTLDSLHQQIDRALQR